MSFFVLFVLLFASNSDLINGSSTCDECRTKTYCLSSDGSPSCSADNLVTAKWSVDKVDNEITGQDPATLTLSANNVDASESRVLAFIYRPPTYPMAYTQYSCFKSGDNVTAIVNQKTETTYRVLQGNGSYSLDGTLTCSWSMSFYSIYWPSALDITNDIIKNNRGSFELISGDKRAVVATDLNELPSHRFNYLKCCNKVHGNDQYMIIFNQTDDSNVNVLIRLIDDTSADLTLKLQNSFNQMFIFNVKLYNQEIEGLLVNVLSADEKLKIPIGNKHIQYSIHPVAFWSFANPGPGPYHVQFEADGQVIYSANDVSLN